MKKSKAIREYVAIAPCRREIQSGRVGTLYMGFAEEGKGMSGLQAAQRVFGQPVCGQSGDCKVTMSWHFDTPRGPVEVSDYWWNKWNELSIRSKSKKAAMWFCASMRQRGYRATTIRVR